MTDYRSYGLTVWFEKMPENNPFEIVSEYGEARTIGRGNSFDEADIYREALEAIMEDGDGKEYEIAEAALEKVSEALVAGLKTAKSATSPTTGFTEGTFEIDTHRHGRQARDGYVCGEFGIHDANGVWRVTHIPSGMAVRALERRTLAKTKAACIEALGSFDWSAPTIEAICAENKIAGHELRVACSKMGE